MNKNAVLKILGIVLCLEAGFLLLPFLFSVLARSGDTRAFARTVSVCAVVGVPLALLPVRGRLKARDGFVAVALGWLVLGLTGALPYFFAGCCGYVDAVFETVSGFSTTGASIFASPADLPRGILLWRALTQWMGGMGVLVLMLALLPKLGEGSVELMKAESPGPITTKLLPRTADTAKVLYSIYLALTGAEALALRIAGMPWFDAVTTAFTTLSTGGFSIRNESIAYYHSEAVVWIVIVFMLLASVNFGLLFLAATGKLREALKSDELQLFAVIVLSAVIMISLDLVLVHGAGAYEAISLASFQAATLVSTTGFATADFALWPPFSQAILITLMCMGGCAGSTAGGIKVSRIAILLKGVRRDLRRILHPREVRPIMLDGARVEERTISSVSLFFFCYILILLVTTCFVSLDGVDFATAFSSALAALSNIGPGIARVGPSCNFGFYSAASKLVLTAAMLLGRLEIMPLLLLFLPSTWWRK